MFLNGTTQNNSFSYTVPTGSNVLIVEASDRTDAGANLVPTITYGGTALKEAVSAEGTASTYINSHIFYLMNPPTNQAMSLVINWAGAINGRSGGLRLWSFRSRHRRTPSVGSFVSELSPTSVTATATVPLAGSVAISEFTYRIGNSGILTQTSTAGTPTIRRRLQQQARWLLAARLRPSRREASGIASTPTSSPPAACSKTSRGPLFGDQHGSGASGTHDNSAVAVSARKSTTVRDQSSLDELCPAERERASASTALGTTSSAAWRPRAARSLSLARMHRRA